VPIWPDRQLKTNVGRVKIAFSDKPLSGPHGTQTRSNTNPNGTEWVIDGPKLWPFENVTPNEILTIVFYLKNGKSTS